MKYLSNAGLCAVFFAPLLAFAQANTSEGKSQVSAIDSYAQAVNKTPMEALLQLEQENEASVLQKKIRLEPDFAALRIVHSPQFKIILYAKGDALGLLRKYTNDPLYVAQAVPRSRQELVEAQLRIEKILHSHRIFEFMSDIDFEAGNIEILTNDLAATRRALTAYKRIFPFINIRAADFDKVLNTTATLRGGHRVYAQDACTSGFSVVNATGVRGILTAAHCGYPARINLVQFSNYLGRMWGGDYDQQWFTKRALSRSLWNRPDHAGIGTSHGLRGRCLSLAHSR